MATDVPAASVTRTDFACPTCGAHAAQTWFDCFADEKRGDTRCPFIPDIERMRTAAFDTKEEQAAWAGKWLPRYEKLATGVPVLTKRSSGNSCWYDLGNVFASQCFNCKEVALWIHERLVFPRAATRGPAPSDVPLSLAADFNEAGAVFSVSAKASAALGRRCLQGVLRDKGYTQHDLVGAIDAVLKSKTLPSHLADNLDAVRNIGNFAAHPLKNTNTGEILPVEPEEAEWNLDVFEGLFDFYYVEPARAQAKRDALNEKLKAAGKPPMK
jgi:hypothetical protein